VVVQICFTSLRSRNNKREKHRRYKKDRTQKVTENALATQTPFPSFHINQILHTISIQLWVSKLNSTDLTELNMSYSLPSMIVTSHNMVSGAPRLIQCQGPCDGKRRPWEKV